MGDLPTKKWLLRRRFLIIVTGRGASPGDDDASKMAIFDFSRNGTAKFCDIGVVFLAKKQ